MILEDIQKILEQEKFESTLALATEEVPFDRLLVFLGLDTKEREQMLDIVASQQQFGPEFSLANTIDFPVRLQFSLQLPFQVQDLALNQVGSLLHFLNQLIDLPGFELNELEGVVVYRYVWMIQPASINPRLIMNIVGAILLNLRLFSDMIESLAEGKISFNDLLTQIIQIVNTTRTSTYPNI